MIQKLEKKMWSISDKLNRLGKKRMAAIKKWDVQELDRLDISIDKLRGEFNTTIDKIKSAIQ